MKASVYTEYGPPEVLHLEEVAAPAPKEHEICVSVRASGVTYGDVTTRNFRNVSARSFNMPWLFWFLARFTFGFRKPKIQILGSQFAGVVNSIGAGVTKFKEGDPVFGYRGPLFGANGEQVCMPEDGIVAIKPGNATFVQAATIPYGAVTALNLLRKVDLRSGQKVLILGASGAIGAAAVQLAKEAGAHVTGVCGPDGLDYVDALGADKVIDYTHEDFTENGETYDLVFDILGKSSFSRCKKSLTQNGRYLLASFKMRQLFQMFWTSMAGTKKVVCGLSMEKPGDLPVIKALVESGKLRSIIDRCFPLEQVAEAHRYVEAGHKKGNVVIVVA